MRGVANELLRPQGELIVVNAKYHRSGSRARSAPLSMIKARLDHATRTQHDDNNNRATVTIGVVTHLVIFLSHFPLNAG